MADDSDKLTEPLEFHPCDSPKGMLYYKLDDLTDYQKIKLKQHKINVIRENQSYLKDHPEIKIIISILLKAILKARPKVKIQHFLVNYLSENWNDLERKISNFIMKKQQSQLLELETVTQTDQPDQATEEFEQSRQSNESEQLLLESKLTESIESLLCILKNESLEDTISHVVPEKTADMCRRIVESLVDQTMDHVDSLEDDYDPVLIFPYESSSIPSLD